ncbi:MAG: ABC transporter ATP-binding protein [Planctomycetota bacterium]
MVPSVIELDTVTASYRMGFTRRRRVVLDAIRFSIPEGSIAGYLGVNGAGKTTTIKLIVGINPPESGRVTVAGHPAGSNASRAALGYLPENPYFYEYLTPVEALDFYGRLSGLGGADLRRRSDEVLAEVDLLHAKDRPVREFSKGMRQRLGLAQAILHRPKLLVLDEPLTGLDPMGRLALRDIILRQRKAGATIFFSSHILSDVEQVCDRIVILDASKIAYEGTVENLLRTVEGEVRVAFDGVPDERLASVSEAAGAPVEKRGARHEATAKDRAAADRALDAVRAAGGRLVLFQPVGVTLEDYFVKTYGKQEATR